MKLGIISDTHGGTEYIERAADKFGERNIDLIAHCGDVTRPRHLQPLFSLGENPLQLALGNCDRNVPAFRRAAAENKLKLHGQGGVLNLNEKKVALTHGDSHYILRRLLKEEPDFLLRGHSHEKTDRRISGTRLINPGSAGRGTHSAAILTTTTGNLEFIDLNRH